MNAESQQTTENTNDFDMDFDGLYDETPTESMPTEKSEPNDEEPISDYSDDSDEKDDSADEMSVDETTPAEKSFKVKIGDREIEYAVKGEYSDEELEEIRLGHLKNADYTAKTRAVAEELKQLEQRKNGIDQVLNALESELKFERGMFETDEMKQLKEYDEDEYNRQVIKFNQKLDKYSQVKQAREQETQELKAQAQQIEYQLVKELIPEWVDETKQKSDVKEMKEYLLSIGVQENELSDYGQKASQIVQTRDAMNYRKLLKSLESKKDKTAPASLKPGSSNNKAAPARTLYDDLKDEMR